MKHSLNTTRYMGLPIAPKRLRGRRLLTVAGASFLAGAVALLGGVGTAAATTTRASSASASASSTDTVAELFPDNTTPRWMTEDAPDFKAWMHKLDPKAKVIIDVADESASTQLTQAQAALTEGAKVLVVIAVDSVAAAKIVTDAQADHVPVIAYTREIYNAPVKYMTGDNPYEIGVTLGNWIVAHTKAGDHIAVIAGSPTDSFAHLEYSGYMKVLSPIFKSGARKEVGPVWTPEWDTSAAHSEMAAFLTETHNNIQAVLASNDSTAEGAVAALQSVGLAGKIPVTGIDATLASDQLILKGLQSMSVYRPIDKEAQLTAELVVDLFKHQVPPKGFFNGSINNKYGPNGISRIIPLAGVPETVITAQNMGQLVKDHVYTKAQLCKGIPSTVAFCK